jgi:hypothetical protein
LPGILGGCCGFDHSAAARTKGAEMNKHAIPAAINKANFRTTSLTYFLLIATFYIAPVLHKKS